MRSVNSPAPSKTYKLFPRHADTESSSGAARHRSQLTIFPRGELDSLKGAIIDLAAGQPHLDSKGFRNHLNNLGFAGTLDALIARTGHMRFTLPSAELNSAEEGLLHVIGLLRERLSVKPEVTATAQALGSAMANPGDPTAETSALSRFEAARQMALESESQRRDLDRAPGWSGED
jgi:DNA primase